MSADQELAQTGAGVAVGTISAILAIAVGSAVVLFKAIAYRAATRK